MTLSTPSSRCKIEAQEISYPDIALFPAPHRRYTDPESKKPTIKA